MKNKVPIYKIIRNIASRGIEYSGEIGEWLEDSEENNKVYQDLLHVWQVTGTFPDRFKPDKQIGWGKVRKQIYSHRRRRLIYLRFVQSAAAVIVVLLSVWLGAGLDKLKQPKYSEIISPAGEKTRIVLPDSSIVLLNGNSQIRYSNHFSEDDRYVELQGEGYFDVHKDLSHRFVVHTSDLDIKVFGTSFNVKAFGEDKDIEVDLINGQIGIERNNKEILRLQAGQNTTFNKNEKKFYLGKTDVNLVSAWTREELVFEEKTFEYIIKYLERWYGVDIKVAPKVLDDELLTFKVKTESLRELLDLIKFLKPIIYEVDGKEVTITKP